MLDKLTDIEKRYEDLNRELAQPDVVRNPALLQKLAREIGDLKEIVELAIAYRQCLARREEAQQIIDAAGLGGEVDDDLVELARGELEEGECLSQKGKRE